ncbi:putative non-specific serine/threonine protein kinase [Helianthus anomalus]
MIAYYVASEVLKQKYGTIVASSIYFKTPWWLLTIVKYICDSSNFPEEGSPWTCPGDDVLYNASIISRELNDNQLTGHISPELGKLTDLFDLNVAGNKLEGHIHDNFSSCTNLHSL